VKIQNINVQESIENVKKLLSEDKNISLALKSAIELLILLVTLLANRLNLNSSNSSKPPASDQNRKKKNKGNASGKKPGGQNGRQGKNLKPIENPDEVKIIPVDRSTLPEADYRDVGYQARQVINILISRHVIEYRAQILENLEGEQFVAKFPDGVKRPVQYGQEFKAHSVYMSQFQLLPYNRIEDYFSEEIAIPVSAGSIYNFNKEAYDLLESFDDVVKKILINSKLLNVDETGINVGGKLAWLHLTANEKFTYFFPHEKRGSIAMNAIGILPKFTGTLCHDHWKPYFIYQCLHALCNAHHLRELQRAFEQDNQQWAFSMKQLLLEINTATKNSGGVLTQEVAQAYCEKYEAILVLGEKECPTMELSLMSDGKKKRGRIKRSKARNLLERLSAFKEDTLRFMKEVDVPFSNNLAENNLRMTKVQQKISGCFRSMEGAYIFARIRSYISTCQKHEIAVTTALSMLFNGEKPDFMNV
jgi:transposase